MEESLFIRELGIKSPMLKVLDFLMDNESFDYSKTDIAEGTVYALLLRLEQKGLVGVEKVPSEKGPPRKVYTINAEGSEYLAEFWRTWGFLAERLEQLRDNNNTITSAETSTDEGRGN